MGCKYKTSSFMALSLQPMISRARFDIFSPLTRGCSEGLDAFRFFSKHLQTLTNGSKCRTDYLIRYSTNTKLFVVRLRSLSPNMQWAVSNAVRYFYRSAGIIGTTFHVSLSHTSLVTV